MSSRSESASQCFMFRNTHSNARLLQSRSRGGSRIPGAHQYQSHRHWFHRRGGRVYRNADSSPETTLALGALREPRYSPRRSHRSRTDRHSRQNRSPPSRWLLLRVELRFRLASARARLRRYVLERRGRPAWRGVRFTIRPHGSPGRHRRSVVVGRCRLRRMLHSASPSPSRPGRRSAQLPSYASRKDLAFGKRRRGDIPIHPRAALPCRFRASLPSPPRRHPNPPLLRKSLRRAPRPTDASP